MDTGILVGLGLTIYFGYYSVVAYKDRMRAYREQPKENPWWHAVVTSGALGVACVGFGAATVWAVVEKL